jgi:hypothetical protein
MTLPLHLGQPASGQPVVVEPGLADRDDLVETREIDEALDRRLATVLFVGMDAGAAPEAVVGERKLVDALELVERRANAQGAVDARRAHRFADFWNAAGQFGRAEMTVRVDEHEAIVRAERQRRRRPRQRGRRRGVKWSGWA